MCVDIFLLGGIAHLRRVRPDYVSQLLSTPRRCSIYPPQSSSSSLCKAGAFGLIVFSQSDERPESYLEPSFFDAIPSKPSWQIFRKTTSAGASIGWLISSPARSFGQRGCLY